jgi:hypothetical protein
MNKKLPLGFVANGPCVISFPSIPLRHGKSALLVRMLRWSSKPIGHCERTKKGWFLRRRRAHDPGMAAALVALRPAQREAEEKPKTRMESAAKDHPARMADPGEESPQGQPAHDY